MKTVLKILPLVIGCAFLLGITSASASCTYIGVTTGQSYDFNYLTRNTNATSSTTYSGTIHFIIANVSSAAPCKVGLTGSITGGNLTSAPGATAFFNAYLNQNIAVVDATTLNSSLVLLIISTSISNKSYYSKNTIGGVTTTHAGSWDSSGMVMWLTDIVQTSSTNSQVTLSRVGSTPGYDSWALLLAGSISIASVVGITLKKRH
ncbi:MAG TPA: hypothetical protein VKM55_22850 [Candidatus Lokiarchaeia archaeon]|nr:hypothetical protein [Candidatus Lokiarchaeia archaeon]